MRSHKDSAVAGLFPAGFSAEHLGPNDYYYWDDFWGVAGLQAAASMLRDFGDHEESDKARLGATEFMEAIESSLAMVTMRLGRPAMPASPKRRLDAGAIGSLVGGYPLQLLKPNDARLLDTAEFLWENSMVDGGFFQDMIHSGINPYLTLHLAQVMLRASDPRYEQLMKTVADLATSTGQWPEAIHPATKGGCMGDGQHAWASAEWIAMVRNCFVMEDLSAHRLIIGAGIPSAWLLPGSRLSLGPTPTPWGPVSVSIDVNTEYLEIKCDGDWFAEAPPLETRLQGASGAKLHDGSCRIDLKREIHI